MINIKLFPVIFIHELRLLLTCTFVCVSQQGAVGASGPSGMPGARGSSVSGV